MNDLTKTQIKKVIEGKGCANRIPILYDIWIYPEALKEEKEVKEVTELLKKVACDVESVFLKFPDIYEAPQESPDYKWSSSDQKPQEGVGIDANVVIREWEETEEFYEKFPSPEYAGMIPQKKPDGGKYVLARWWYLLFERLWSLRGMENALMDFYLYPEEVHKLFQRLTDFYMRAMERAKHELDADGIFASDDIGTQTGPFFSLSIFREFFKPYYKQLFDKAHELNMHFWLHTCGNVELFLSDLIEIGLDVIHPIQKNTMDEKEIAEKYGNQICILAGFDVQQTIPFGTTEEVRGEVCHLIDTFANEKGRFMLTMGNGTTPDWKRESLEALYEETISYGEFICRRFIQYFNI